MPLRPLTSVFATQPASFRAACSLEDAISRFGAVVKRSVWQEWSSDCLIGSVSRDRVVVRWHRGGTRDFLPATFSGRFLADGDGLVLAGHFQHGTASRILLTAMVAVLMLFFAASVVFGGILLLATAPVRDKALSGVLIGALIVASGLAVWWSTQPLDPKDVDTVSQAINQALNDGPSNQAHSADGAPRHR